MNSLNIQLQSILKCPNCGFRVEETMPTDACVHFYDCPRCETRLKPKPGDCCVFCSYGTVKCPPHQANVEFCGAGGAREETNQEMSQQGHDL